MRESTVEATASKAGRPRYKPEHLALPTSLQTGLPPRSSLFQMHGSVVVSGAVDGLPEHAVAASTGTDAGSRRGDASSRRSSLYSERVREEHREFFTMRTPTMTPEIKRDLQVIQLRKFANPKRFYKGDDFKELPATFQIGVVQDGPFDKQATGSSRGPGSAKRKAATLAEEILTDPSVQKYTKKVYNKLQHKRKRGGKKEYERKRNQRRGKLQKTKQFA